MGFSAVTIGDKFVAQNTEIAQMPTITGTFEQERLTGSWDFRKQGNQQISLGGATLFVISPIQNA